MRKKVAGFDYVTGCPVAMAARTWQEKYRECNRSVYAGETFFHSVARRDSRGDVVQPRIVAEAYANIPPAPGQRSI